MHRLSSVQELIELRGRVSNESGNGSGKLTLVVCAGTGGLASGSNNIIRVIKRHILERGLQDQIRLRITGCQGFCEMDPFIVVEPGQHLYPKLKMEDVARVVDAALGGFVDDDLIYRDPRDRRVCHDQKDIPFFRGQTRTLLGNNQKLDPIRVFDYIGRGGYAAIEKVLSDPNPEWVIREIKASGLRGRGGAGFPTGNKWELTRSSGRLGEPKYVVCNADEGDPGAYMDRSLLEGNPHAIIEGMMIGAIAVGATQGFVYVRSEYPLAIKHLLIALRQVRDLGLLGPDILGTGISFDIDIVRGAGAFVCGEETALIRSIEGRMGEPRQRPPYPIECGINGYPTCINNVETWANVPVIISGGSAAYAAVGVPGNSGTKIFSLVGKIRNTGLVEIPLGMKIRDVVYEIGGGPLGRMRLKAVQTGGPSGGCIPASMFDLPIDYESLKEAGSMMGSGGMIVMDEGTCMVDVAKYFMSFLKEESCGKCFTCRKGTQRMQEILEDITLGKATSAELNLLEELALAVKDTTMCGLGQSAPNPVLSTLRYFRHEYEGHIHRKKCDAYVCKELVGAPCQSSCPVGTEAWHYVALIEKHDYEGAYRVIRDANPLPSVCARVCNHPCEDKCRAATSGGEAISIRALKRFVTDRVGPAPYVPMARKVEEGPRVAIVGAGPAGLAAAHYLSLTGYRSTIFEAEDRPGGMMVSAIPAYRLPREGLMTEIDALIDPNVTLEVKAALGRDFTLDGLLSDGFDAVFLATGAHRSRRLQVPGEDVSGVLPSIQFLKEFNLRGVELARGRVGIIGGGNAALDAARVAIRQHGVSSVTIYYRRTREEMPAYEEEVVGALEEGIGLVTLVTPKMVLHADNSLTGVQFVKNDLGPRGPDGRRQPVPLTGTEYVVHLDTVIVAISEEPDVELLSATGLALTEWGTIAADADTLATSRTGVFAGGDVVSGPRTVIEAIAAGKKAAAVIDRYLRGELLVEPARPNLPEMFIPPPVSGDEVAPASDRVKVPTMPATSRVGSFVEVEGVLSEEEAVRETRRCLRCDLEFTQRTTPRAKGVVDEEEQACLPLQSTD